MVVILPNAAFISETSRAIAVARALTAAGVPVTIASHGGPYAHLLDEAGLPWRRLTPTLDPAGAAEFLAALLEMGGRTRPMHPHPWVMEAVASEAALLREVGARLVVTGFALTAYLSSRVAGIPMATVHGGSFVPPVFEARLAPAPLTPVDPALAGLPTGAQRWLANIAPPWVTAPVAWLNRAADELGVERVPSLAALMCGDLTLVTDLPEVLGVPREVMSAWRPGWFSGCRPGTRMRYAGPIFAKLDRPVPPRVEAFLCGPRPVAYVAPTSVDATTLRAMILATRAAGVRVLAAATLHDVGDLADDEVMIEPLLPNHLIMSRVAVVIAMGGQGTVSTAMACGAPIIGFPLHPEQELNVALAERRGVGRRLPLRDAGTPALTEAVRQILDDPGLPARLAETRALYDGVDGAREAAREIVAFLANPSGSGT
jgi:UDP:flavonoid glycosyltransferase YjiC (YdhE family)